MKRLNHSFTVALSVMLLSGVWLSKSPQVYARDVKANVKANLSHLLQLRRDDERYAVRAWMDEHPELNNDPRALAESALNFANMGWLKQALESSERAVALGPEDDYVLASRAWVLNRSRVASPALWAAKKAVTLQTNARNLAVLAQVLQSQQVPEKADQMLSQARKIDPDSFDVVLAATRISLARMKGADAPANVSEYLKRHPEDIRALLLRSEVLETTGKRKDAINDITSVLKLKPAHTFALQKRAELYQKEKELARAAADLRKLLTLKIDKSARLTSNLVLAQCLESLGDLKGALAAYTDKLDLESQINNVDIKKTNTKLPGAVVKDVVECCRLEIALHQYKPALAKLNPLLSTVPNNTQARELHALALEGQSRWKEAIEDWSRLIDRHSSYPKWYSNRARAYKKLGNDAAARQDLDAAAKLSI